MAWDWGDSQVLGALNGGGAKNVEEGGGRLVAFLRELKQQTKKHYQAKTWILILIILALVINI